MELTFLLDAGSSITPHCSIMSQCLSFQSLVSKLPHHLPLLHPLSCCIDVSAQSTIKMLYDLAILGIDYLYTFVFASRTILLFCTSPLLYINYFCRLCSAIISDHLPTIGPNKHINLLLMYFNLNTSSTYLIQHITIQFFWQTSTVLKWPKQLGIKCKWGTQVISRCCSFKRSWRHQGTTRTRGLQHDFLSKTTAAITAFFPTVSTTIVLQF